MFFFASHFQFPLLYFQNTLFFMWISIYISTTSQLDLNEIDIIVIINVYMYFNWNSIRCIRSMLISKMDVCRENKIYPLFLKWPSYNNLAISYLNSSSIGRIIGKRKITLPSRVEKVWKRNSRVGENVKLMCGKKSRNSKSLKTSMNEIKNHK